jgi:hypothetical protein
MSADYINNGVFFRKLNTSIFRPGNSKRHWGVLLVTALYIFILGLSQCLKPVFVHAKESQVELGPYEVIISKDPFDPERGKSQFSSSVAEGNLKGEYQVYGTIIAGEMRQAFLMVATSKSSSSPYKKVAKGSQKGLRTVTVGDLINGWRVADITAQGVKFESDGEYIEVGIFDAVKKERKATSPVALQTPHPKPQVTPQSTPAKRPSSSEPGSRSQIKSGKRTPQHSKTFGPAETSTSSGPRAENGGTEGAPNQPEFFTPPASPGDQGGPPNPFLKHIRKAKE